MRQKWSYELIVSISKRLHPPAWRLSIPTGLHPSAQGCEARATLGKTCRDRANPERVVSLLGSSHVVKNSAITLSGFVKLRSLTQGSSFLATLGFATESLWDSFLPTLDFRIEPLWDLLLPNLGFRTGSFWDSFLPTLGFRTGPLWDSFLATLRFVTESLWDSSSRIRALS